MDPLEEIPTKRPTESEIAEPSKKVNIPEITEEEWAPYAEGLKGIQWPPDLSAEELEQKQEIVKSLGSLDGLLRIIGELEEKVLEFEDNGGTVEPDTDFQQLSLVQQLNTLYSQIFN